MNIESEVNVGDAVMFYGSIAHGVDQWTTSSTQLEFKGRSVVYRNVCE